jgi:hypothetical protein
MVLIDKFDTKLLPPRRFCISINLWYTRGGENVFLTYFVCTPMCTFRPVHVRKIFRIFAIFQLQRPSRTEVTFCVKLVVDESWATIEAGQNEANSLVQSKDVWPKQSSKINPNYFCTSL